MLPAQFAFSIVNSPIVVAIARCFVTGSVQVLIPINYRWENALVFLVAVYRQKHNATNQTNSKQSDTHELDKTTVNSVSHEAVKNSVEFEPKGKRNLVTAKFFGRTLRNMTRN